ncbi:MAG: PAS domain S-box protein [Bryobacteraceae bacterium]
MNGETHRPEQPAVKENMTDAAIRVLLVEDSPSDADLLQQTLQTVGADRFEFTWVERLDDALARLGQASFDVLLLDLSLPDSSGPETFRRALHAAPHLAIVVLTGASDESLGLAAVHEGVEDYLVKGQSDGRQIARAIRYAIERKHIREQLRQQREWLRVTLASIGDGVLATDTAGRITLLNPIAAGLTGWPEEQALGQPVQHVFQIINEQTRQLAEDIVGRVLREGRAVSLANQTALVTRDGREIPIEDSAAPIRDGAGEVAGAVLVFHDVTGTRRAQQALRDSESRLHTLSDNLPEGAIYRYCHSIDGKPHFEFFSAGIERLTGIPAAELMGDAATAENSILPEDRDRLRAAIALSREKLTQFEVAVRRKHRTTGEVRWSLLRSTPTRNPDGSTTWDGIELDITERQRGEEALRENRAKLAERTLQLERTAAELEKRNREVERVNRMKTDFLARSSHELRTPLNAIIGYSDLLGEQSAGPLPSPYPRFVANIQDGARHLLAMVNDLLDISRIETGHIDLNREAFRPAETLEEVLSVIAPFAGIKNISIENEIPGGLWIRADRTRFKQVLYNLLSNAVKFTPENGRVWIAEASREDAAGFCIGDTGIGIPESELEAIFDEFHQVSGSSGSATEGTGLGLAITRRLVELHGGAIRVESTIGQGSRFILSLGPHSLEHPNDGAAV